MKNPGKSFWNLTKKTS